MAAASAADVQSGQRNLGKRGEPTCMGLDQRNVFSVVLCWMIN